MIRFHHVSVCTKPITSIDKPQHTPHFMSKYDRTLSFIYSLHDLLSPTPPPSSRVCRHVSRRAPSSPSGASSSSSRGHTHIPHCKKHFHDRGRPHIDTFEHRTQVSLIFILSANIFPDPARPIDQPIDRPIDRPFDRST